MNKNLINRTKEKLKEGGLEDITTKKYKRSWLYRAAVPLTKSSIVPLVVIEGHEDNKRKRFVAIEKSKAEKEFENLRWLKENLGSDHILNFPQPKLLIEEDDVLVAEYIPGKSVAELVVLSHFLLGPSAKDLSKAYEKLGLMISELHNSTYLGEKIAIGENFNELLSSVEKYLMDDLMNDLYDLKPDSIEAPKVFAHRDLGMGNIRYDEGDVGIVDWPGSKFSQSFYELHRSKELHKKKNYYSFLPGFDLEDIWDNFFQSYKENVDFVFDDYDFYFSGIVYLLKKIKKRPEKINKRTYRDLLREYIKGIS